MPISSLNLIKSSSLKLVDLLIGMYQVVLSPDHGLIALIMPVRTCRHQPTCSQYTRHNLRRFGWSGLLPSLKQFLSCHPFNTSS